VSQHLISRYRLLRDAARCESSWTGPDDRRTQVRVRYSEQLFKRPCATRGDSPVRVKSSRDDCDRILLRRTRRLASSPS